MTILKMALMNKKGQKGMWSSMLGVILVIGVIFFGLGAFTYFTTGKWAVDFQSFTQKYGDTTVADATKQTTPIGDALNNARLNFLSFVFGQVPDYLVGVVGQTSAVIIILGIWLLLLLSFGNIVEMYGTFNRGISWLIAVILVIIVTNLKLVTFLSVFMLVFAAGLGAFAVFLNIIGIFVIFILFNFGSTAFMKWVVARRNLSLSMLALTGKERIARGMAVAAAVAKEAEKAGKEH